MVNIPDSVTSIGGGGAFEDCESLTSIRIPNSVTDIGNFCFNGCTSLTSVNIHNSVTQIKKFTFHNCISLASVIIPSSVTYIGDSAFQECENLTSITIEATTPPYLGELAFEGSTCPIYVPAESVDAYKAASGWSDYADRIQPIV